MKEIDKIKKEFHEELEQAQINMRQELLATTQAFDRRLTAQTAEYMRALKQQQDLILKQQDYIKSLELRLQQLTDIEVYPVGTKH